MKTTEKHQIKGLPGSSETYPYSRGLAGPEIADFWGLNGPLLPQNPLEKVGVLRPEKPTFQLSLEVKLKHSSVYT